MDGIQVSFRDVLLSFSKSPCRLLVLCRLSCSCFNSIIKQSYKHHWRWRKSIKVVTVHCQPTNEWTQSRIRWILCNHWRACDKRKTNFSFIVSAEIFASNCQTARNHQFESLTAVRLDRATTDGASHAQLNHLACSMIYDVVWVALRSRKEKERKGSHHWMKAHSSEVCVLAKKAAKRLCARRTSTGGKNHRKPVGALISRWEYLLFHFWNSCRVVIFLSLAIVFVLFPDNSWRIFPLEERSVQITRSCERGTWKFMENSLRKSSIEKFELSRDDVWASLRGTKWTIKSFCLKHWFGQIETENLGEDF